MEFLRYVAEYTNVNVIFFSPAGLSQFWINLSINQRLKIQAQPRADRVLNV